VETEKRGSLIKAWEENEKAKAENKYVIYIDSYMRFHSAVVLSVTSGNPFFSVLLLFFRT
jgi:hypothetical protein